MVVLGDPNDRFHHIREAAATASAFLQRVIDLRGHDQIPGILVEQLDNRILDLLFRDEVAVANQHAKLGIWLTAALWRRLAMI
jgi:hypothetical protein